MPGKRSAAVLTAKRAIGHMHPKQRRDPNAVRRAAEHAANFDTGYAIASEAQAHRNAVVVEALRLTGHPTTTKKRKR